MRFSVHRYVFIVLSFALVFAFKPAGKQFEGVITYGITYLELPPEVQGMESMLPQETAMHLKGDKTMIEQEVMGGSQRVVVDNKDSSSFILMDMMGQKICINLSKEEIREAAKDISPPRITYQKETKQIIGYTCRKATLTTDSGVTTVFYTNKLNIPKHKDFGQLDGFPLEYEVFQNNMKLRMTAQSIDEKELDESLFTIPSGYTIMSMDELQQLTGGR